MIIPVDSGLPGPVNLLAGLLLCALALCSACTATTKVPASCAGEEHSASIYVVNQGWHAGLIVRRADIPAGLWPEKTDFPAADYLELGWGDWDYYQADVPGLWMTLKAALWPTASVLHVAGVQGTVADRYGGFEIIRLDVAGSRFVRLAAYIDRSFARNNRARVRPLGPGWSGDSLFYPARGKFHLFNTCNGWIASALEASGYPMGLLWPITADQLMAKVRPYAAPESCGTASSYGQNLVAE